MDGAKRAVQGLWDLTSGFFGALKDGVTSTARVMGRVADIITTPYQLAFRGIASLWNRTVGALSFTIPGWVPGIGGSGFDVPNIPELARGGTARAGMPHIVGERGPELFVPNSTGTVVPNGGFGGQTITVVFAAGDPIWEALKKNIRVKGGIGPNSVQTALGS
jgi:hypothetical protein